VKYKFLGLLALVAGCTSVGQVLPTGKDTYMVTAVGANGPFSQNGLEAAVVKVNRFCSDKGQAATIAETSATRQVPFLAPPSNVVVQFTCTDADHQRPSVLRPDNGISTNN
jgi:hypothetical protein